LDLCETDIKNSVEKVVDHTSFVKVSSVADIHYLQIQMNFYLYLPYLLLDFSEIQYRRSPGGIVERLSLAIVSALKDALCVGA
jgi:hypothetical protein